MIFLLILILPVTAQELYWEAPMNLSGAGAYYPQAVTSDQGFLFMMWQEYDQADQTKITLWGTSSDNGTNWEDPVMLLPPVSYTGEDRVSLFSLTQDRDGNPVVALTASEREIGIYKLNQERNSLEETSVVTSERTVVVPRIFRDKNRNLLLFLTQRVLLPNDTEALSIFSTGSRDGLYWSNLEHFVRNPDLKQNFLPYYTYDSQGEYLVFQSLYSGTRNTYQIYFTSRKTGESEWSNEKQITGFSQYRTGREYEFFQFDNQRPHIYAEEGTIHLVWERRLGREAPQIYYLPLDVEGNTTGELEQISRGSYFTASPRIIRNKGYLYILFFDNRNGNQVVLARRNGIFWQEKNLSLIRGDSTYARWLNLENDMFVYWENQSGQRRSAYLLRPDKTSPLPIIRTENFRNGGRQAGDRATISWRRPADSSGIMGFSYIWDRDPDTDPPEDSEQADLRERTVTFQADEDGLWYFHIKTLDYAGNWSETLNLSLTRDTTPPDPVNFIKPPTDETGYLVSNTFSILWDTMEEFLGGFSYSLKFLGENVDYIDPDTLNLPPPPRRVMTSDRGVQYTNRDNGIWALSVTAFDDVGNRSEPKTLLFRTNKYIPVTYISDIQSSRDRLERVVLSLIGRGFQEGGDVSTVLIDRDGKAPWDYEFKTGEFNVRTDRIIDGVTVEVLEEGTYRVGVVHPLRGMVFARGRLKLDSTGVVRFGDFSYEYKTFWQPVSMALDIWNLNKTLFFMILVLLLSATSFTTLVIFQIVRENSYLEQDVRAVLEGQPLTAQMKKERLKSMKKRGLRLRLKFVLAILSLILFVTLTVAISLGQYMIKTQQTNLSEGLYQRSALLLETLASGSRSYLPTQNRLELGLLPGQISAMDDALNTTITGIGVNDPEHFNYIWASNNSRINKFQLFPSQVKEQDLVKPADWPDEQFHNLVEPYLKENNLYDFSVPREEDRSGLYELLLSSGQIGNYSAGETAIDDSLNTSIEEFQKEINEKAATLIGDQNIQLDQLSEDAVRLALRGDTKSLEELRVIQETISRIETEINDKLKTVANVVRTFPDFTVENLNPDQNSFVFYKPIVYRNKGLNTYFRGIVRLEVSIENILNEIIRIQKNIIQITVIISLIAIGAGFLGAMLLAQTLISPIRKLVQAVEKVRDTQDKSKLSGHVIELKTRDELSDLARTFNQMTEGLVKAAVASKELTLGKEIQKKFIPLETVKVGDRKLTTGEAENDNVHFFGYYEGAKGVSGDYFDFRQLDDEHYAIIKCDIAGKGIPASLIMVEVATIFINYFKNVNIAKDGIHLEKLVFSINDLLEEVGFEGRFAAFIVIVMNVRTGKCWMCNAGDNLVHIYNNEKKEMYIKTINEVPAAGVFPSWMLDGNKAYKQLPHMMKSGDVLFLFTDGIEEAQRHFRDSNYELITCDDSCGQDEEGKIKTHEQGSDFEEFGFARIHDVIESVLHKQSYALFKYHNPDPERELTFDFSECSGTVDQAVMALVAVEKIYRLNPDPSAGKDHRIRIDSKIDGFLKKHFDQYREYFRYPIDDEEYPEYTYYSHLKEDEQYDDLTILAIKKK